MDAELRNRMLASGHVVVLTGAGVSAESGVPTFRDALTGLWAQYRPEELATPEAFQRQPGLVWDWYRWRRELIGRAHPNAAHEALAVLEQRTPRLTLITQNVDDLHRRAGSQRIIALHGDISLTRCSGCGMFDDEFDESLSPPSCRVCGAHLRPDVVWFGESLPRTALAAAMTACECADVFLSIGTSTVVQPAASLPFLAKEHGAFAIEINPNPTPFSPLADRTMRVAAAAWLPSWIESLWPDGR